MVEEHCRDGRSLTSFAAEIGVCRDTINEWRKVHPQFSAACSRALTRAQTWFEEQCRSNLGNREFNARLAEFQMAARFEDYRPQTQRIEISGPGGGAIPLKPVSDAELLRLAAPVLDAEVIPPAALPAPADDPAPKSGE
jgi:hypothetical protein